MTSPPTFLTLAPPHSLAAQSVPPKKSTSTAHACAATPTFAAFFAAFATFFTPDAFAFTGLAATVAAGAAAAAATDCETGAFGADGAAFLLSLLQVHSGFCALLASAQ